MPHVNNLNFPDYMFVPYFLHYLGDNFGKQKQHEMIELSIPCVSKHQPRVTIL